MSEIHQLTHEIEMMKLDESAERIRHRFDKIIRQIEEDPDLDPMDLDFEFDKAELDELLDEMHDESDRPEPD